MLLPVFALKMGDAPWLPYQDVQPKRLGCGSGLPHIVPFFVQKKAALYQKDCTYCRQTKDRKTLSVLQQQVLAKELRTAGFSAVHIKGGI